MTELKLQQCRLDGRYDIQDCLGRGSYAEIYVTRDTAAADGMPSTVVIKALNVQLQGVPDHELERTLIENFQNEAIALDRVRHPNIISRLGHGTAIDLAGTTFHYIVLEYLPGGDLGALCREKPLTLEDTLFYLQQVCAGLAHAHDCGVIHRDIKPQNLLLSNDKRTVKIADFGVAKMGSTEGVITRVGTNVYAAPEHNPLVHTGPLETGALTGAPPNLTSAADVYSLAKTTYTLLIGTPPRRFAHKPVTELPSPAADKPWARAVLRVLHKATQNNPRSRYQTVKEFWDELNDAAMPATQLLNPLAVGEGSPLPRKSELDVKPEGVREAPPRPTFEPSSEVKQYQPQGAVGLTRPRIVVRVADEARAPENGELSPQLPPRRQAHEIIAMMPDAKFRELTGGRRQPHRTPKRGTRLLVALILITAFAGMLLATHNYFRGRWKQAETSASASRPAAAAAPAVVVGREYFTTTDIHLRPGPSLSNQPVGIAERNSRVRIISVRNNFLEIQVLQHGRAKDDPASADRGWIKKGFLNLNS